MNGITYSSVAGVLGGSPLPFTSCFDTMVVAPFTCANGQNPPPYSHQISFTASEITQHHHQFPQHMLYPQVLILCI
jgi:hypothetical protein